MSNNNNIKMFLLNKFRKTKENFYNDKTECDKRKKKYGIISNPRFKLFDQVYFHAGDYRDINKYAFLPIRYFYSMNNENIDKNNDTLYKLYKNIDYVSVYNTFTYMFNKFKKGIFVVIRDNKLAIYLPFSNANYKNNWVKYTYFTEEEKRLLENGNYKNSRIKHILNKNIIDFQRKYPEQFQGRKIDFDRESWYANNCLFRNQFPKYEGELNTTIIKNMLETLVKERVVPDVEFFINDRDFPILKKDFTEPYNHIFDSNKVKIEKIYQFKKMAPLFSKSITDDFADLLLPSNDEWEMAASNKFFLPGCSDGYHKTQIEKWNYNWKSKKSICVFRGGATGCGTRIDNNMRLKAADIAVDYPDILDIGIMDWKGRPKKVIGEPIHIIDTSKFRFGLKNPINNIEKSNYKFILNIDGYVSAFRLASELSMNSCILIVKSPYKMWFSHLLIEYEHYIPIKEDLSDLVSQVQWCIKNDKKCEQIAQNSKKLYETKLNKEGILDYLLEKCNAIYNNKNLKNMLAIKPIKKMKNIAVITIYRDSGDGMRKKQKDSFIKLMNVLLKPYCNFHIYIIEQSDDGNLFNIGKLKNIGFDIANKNKNKSGKSINYDNFIFSDIDTIPDYDLISYYIDKFKYPVSLAVRGTRYMNDTQKKIFLGALLLFNKKQFFKVNGYPNNFYGWGGEDEALKCRLLSSGIGKFYYPKKGSIIDMEETEDMKTINNVQEKKKMVFMENTKFEKLYEDLESWKKNGLSNLNYKILDVDEKDNITQIKVDLLKEKDEKNNPFLYNIKQVDNFKKIKNIVKNKFKDLIYEYV